MDTHLEHIIIQLTQWQRRIVFLSLALIQVEAPRTSRARAVELLSMAYGGRRRLLGQEPIEAKRTAFALSNHADRLPVILGAIDQAKATGAEDDAAALAEICASFIASAPSRNFANDFDRADAFLRSRAKEHAGSGASAQLRGEARQADDSLAGDSGAGGPIPGPDRSRAGSSPGDAIWSESTRASGRDESVTEHTPSSGSPQESYLHLHSVPRPRGNAQPAPAACGTRIGRTGFDPKPGLGVERGTSPGASPLGCLSGLVEALGRDEKSLRRFLEEPARWYTRRSKAKKRGRRVYYEPHPELLAVQRQLLVLLRPRISCSPLLRRTPEETAGLPSGRPWFIKLDIRDFFPSVTTAYLGTLLDRLGATAEVRDIVLGLTTLKGFLPQGAATSPGFAELVLADLDKRVYKEAQRRGVVVTRWVDDVGIGGDDRAGVEAIARLYASQLAKIGLRVRRTEPLPLNIRRRFLKLNLHSKLSLPKAYRRKVASAVRRVARYGCTQEQRLSLASKIARIGRLHPRQAQRLKLMLCWAPALWAPEYAAGGA